MSVEFSMRGSERRDGEGNMGSGRWIKRRVKYVESLRRGRRRCREVVADANGAGMLRRYRGGDGADDAER